MLFSPWLKLFLAIFASFESFTFAERSPTPITESFSLRPPYYNSDVMWRTSGSALFTPDYIQLTPDGKSQTGQMWSTVPFFGGFEIHLKFVIGNGKAHGADGLAFWFTAEPGKDGILFGNQNRFNGLGIIFDSFDNSRWYQVKKFPAVYAVHGTGHQEFENSAEEGARQVLWKKAIAFRSFDFRESGPIAQASPAHIIIKYLKGVLTVDVDQNYDSPDMDSQEGQANQFNWARLFEVPVELPYVGYFGLTAATGDVSDHHIVKQFLVYKDASELNDNPEPRKFIGSEDNHLSSKEDEASSVEKVSPDSTGINRMIKDITASSEQLNNFLHLQFDELKDHIEKVNKKSSSSLKSLRMSVDKVYTILHTSTQNTERVREKLPSVTALTSNLREKVTKVSVLLGSLTDQAQKAHDVQSGILEHVQETSVKHSIAFWIFFCFYQLLFGVVVLFWRLKKADKSRSRFGNG